MSTLNEERGGIAEGLHSFYPQLSVQKTKASIYKISKDVEFNFIHFANFKFAYFGIE